MLGPKAYWDKIYSDNAPDAVSWFQPHPTLSLRMIADAALDHEQRLIDVGGGASTLVDDLLDAGFKNVSVLDISAAAQRHVRKRLGERMGTVEWIEADITKFTPRRRYALWHDRAVLHFLTEENDRQSYLRALTEALAPGGHVVIATFSLEGPKECSRLNVVRYDAEALRRFFGDAFELKATESETHHTPWGAAQKFVYCRFQKK